MPNLTASSSKVTEAPPRTRDAQSTRAKQRLSGSCDVCRQRKVKCDSKKFPDGQCTTCRTHAIPCTHDKPTQKPGVKQFTKQITALSQRVKELEDLLEQQKNSPSSGSEIAGPVSDITTSQEPSPRPAVEQADQEYIKMVSDMQKFFISDAGVTDRFFGPSSNVFFTRQLMSSQAVAPPPGPIHKKLHYWEADALIRPQLSFPEDDLMQTLFTIYFKYRPAYLCAIHEPSFRRDVASNLHLSNSSFGTLVLLVCAIASRASSDPRVLLDGTRSEHSAGWKYVVQTISYNPAMTRPNFHDVQYFCLLAEYMLGSSNPQATWQIVGQGMRFAVELGLHRRRDDKVNAQSELQKRVFWTLYILERGISLFHGRPSTVADDEIDVEIPLSCDDEYWNTGDPLTDFKQPPNVPSKMDVFVCMIKLSQILSFTLRTVFNGIRKLREGPCEEIQNHIALIDSMLNSWFSSIPAHLSWGTGGNPSAFLEQSTEVYMMYYNLQISIHRPFVYTSSPIALPSLAICTNAARSCIRLMNIRHERGLMLSTLTNLASFAAGSAIVMNMWHVFRSGFPLVQRDIDDVHHCLRAMQSWGTKFHMTWFLIWSLKTISKGLPLDDLAMTPIQACELEPQSQTSSQPPAPDMSTIVTSIPTVQAPYPEMIPSGYAQQPNGLPMEVDFLRATTLDWSQWNEYSQADMSLLEDMDMQWLGQLPTVGDPALENNHGHDWNGFLGMEFLADGMDNGVI